MLLLSYSLKLDIIETSYVTENILTLLIVYLTFQLNNDLIINVEITSKLVALIL